MKTTMKKKIMLLNSIVALTAATISANAQTITIPNGGFDTWSVVSGVEKPSGGWIISDEMGMTCSPLTSVKTTDTAVGSHALYLQTGNCDGNAHEGFAFNIFPVTTKPTELRLKYKSTRVSDSADVEVKMLKRVSGVQTVIGYVKYKIGNSVAAYTALNIPITYSFTETPDTAIVTVESDDLSTAALGNKLWIDDMSFWKPAPTGVDQVETAVLTAAVYPNPAQNNVNLQYTIAESGTVKATLHNIMGAVVATEQWNDLPAGTHTHVTALDDLPAGIYYYLVSVNSQPTITAKFVKQ